MANYQIPDKSLAGVHISTNLANYEAARTSFFTFHITGNGINNNFRDLLYEKAKDVFGTFVTSPENVLENLSLNVTKASVPHYSLEVLRYQRGNDTIKFAGVPTYDSGSVTIDDVVGLDTKTILLAWKELAYNSQTHQGGRMKDYKVDCTLAEYTQDFELIRTWTLYGCWVSSVSEDGFDKESDGKRSLSATIEYDRAIMQLPQEIKA